MRYDVAKNLDCTATLAEALGRWGGEGPTLVPTDGGVNLVGRFRELQGGAERYVRLIHQSHRTREHVEAELEFVTFLKERKCSVAGAMASNAGGLIEVIESAAGKFYASVFEAAEGVRDTWGKDADNRRILFEQGRELGRMHAATREFKPRFKRFGWDDDGFAKFIGPHLPASQEKVRHELDAVLEWTAKYPRTNENYGLIHGDYGTINYRRQGKTLTAFDFDDCCYHWFAFDVAVAIRPAIPLEAKYRKPYLKCMLEGYATQCPLTFSCVEVGWLSRLSNLFRYLHLIRNWDLVNLTEEQNKEIEDRYKAAAEPVEWC